MRKIVLTYGSIAGAIMAGMLVITGQLCGDESFGKYGMLVGYATMLLAFTLIFFAIRTYRQQHDNVISFGRAFSIGMLVLLISGIIYVIGWAFVYHFLVPDFLDKMATAELSKLNADHASAEKIKEFNDQMQSIREAYKSPILFSLLTFLEPLPPGILVTLICSFILRKKPVVA